MDKLLLKPSEAFQMLGICRSKGYAMLAASELPSIRIGRAVRIPLEALKQWVIQQTGVSNESRDKEAAI
jgi:excisionase family DNA binding protein